MKISKFRYLSALRVAVLNLAAANRGNRLVVNAGKLAGALALLLFSALVQSATISSTTPSSADGTFTVSYGSNTSYYAYIIELSSDGSDQIILAESGSKTSGSVKVTKPNGTYGYLVRWCDRLTGGYAGNCRNSGVRNITVNKTSSVTAVGLAYSYDALGRLVTVKENSTAKVGYCYDEAGNRRGVAQGSAASDPCSAYPDEPLPPPSNLSSFIHTGGGSTINWGMVPGATYYRLRLDNGTQIIINDVYQTTYYTNTFAESPYWIQACDSETCSIKAYF